MGALSFWYFWTIQARKKLINLILKKGKILGESQYGSISADWIFRVAKFGFHYLRHFSINFGNSCAHLAANSLNFPKLPPHLSLDGFEGSCGQKTQKIRNKEICQFEPTLKLKLFWGWDFSDFFSILCPKNTWMKIAHIELSNKHKTLGKLQNIRDLEGGWAVLPFKQHPVFGRTIAEEAKDCRLRR